MLIIITTILVCLYVCMSENVCIYIFTCNLALSSSSVLIQPFVDAFIRKLQILCNISLQTHTHTYVHIYGHSYILAKAKIECIT